MLEKATQKDKKEFDRRIPVCGICFKKFIPNPFQDENSEFAEFIADCEHYPKVTSHIGLPTKKSRVKKLKDKK